MGDWTGHERRGDAQLGERVAVVESEMKEIRREHTEILETLQSIRSDLSRYKGVLGGIIFVVSALAAGIEAFGGFLKDHWK